jgi:putative DNA primase/helicase
VTSFDLLEQELRSAMASQGIVTDARLVPDGVRRRFHVEGDRPGSRNGWCIFFGDGIPAAAFGSWRLGVAFKWRANASVAAAPDWLERVQRARVDREQRELLERHRAARMADWLWQRATPARPDHAYLTRKNVRAHGLRQLDDRLVVSMRDATGALVGLQFIASDGSKRFLRGTPKTGSYYSIGRLGPSLVVSEGVATGATIHEATGLPVAIAFDAGNLRPVAEILRAKYPDTRLCIAGDDDRLTRGNPGRTAAEAAARAVGGVSAFPAFASDLGTDFNDLASMYGLGAVRDALSWLSDAAAA